MILLNVLSENEIVNLDLENSLRRVRGYKSDRSQYNCNGLGEEGETHISDSCCIALQTHQLFWIDDGHFGRNKRAMDSYYQNESFWRKYM